MTYEIKVPDGSTAYSVTSSPPAVITYHYSAGSSESASMANRVEIPNELTRRIMADTDAGRNIVRCKDSEDLFHRLGI